MTSYDRALSLLLRFLLGIGNCDLTEKLTKNVPNKQGSLEETEFAVGCFSAEAYSMELEIVNDATAKRGFVLQPKPWVIE